MTHQSRMTIKGQVTVPKDIRDALGLKPGEMVEFVRKKSGEMLLRKKKRDASREAAKRTAIRKNIASVAGSLAIGKPTEQLMRELRGDDPLL